MKPDLSDNLIHPFLIDHSHIRGQFVRLNGVVDQILSQHNYPPAVSRILGEMLVLAAMLASNLKTEGILTLQAKGSGPVKFMVVDATETGALRGYAEIKEPERHRLPNSSRSKSPPLLSKVFGEGYLALTLDTGQEGGRYQGIVDLAASTLEAGIRQYFVQSQQVEVAVRLRVMRNGKQWQAGGIMIERLPREGGLSGEETLNEATQHECEEASEQWERIKLFMETVTDSELLSDAMPSWTLLERLFSEDGVWAYQTKPLTAQCRCSRGRIEAVLKTLPAKELETMSEGGEITVNCQFCNTDQHFSADQISAF